MTRVLGAVAGSVTRPEALIRALRHELISAQVAALPVAPDAAWCAAQRAVWRRRLEEALGMWCAARSSG